MSIIDRTLNRFGLYSERQFNHKLNEAVKLEIDRKVEKWMGETAEAQKFHMPNIRMYANQADLYRISPILGTAIDVLAGDIGTSKFNVKRSVGEEVRDIPNHEFELTLRTPNPADSSIELQTYTVSNYKLNGNSFWWLNRAVENDVVMEIWPIPPSMIEPIPDDHLYISHYNYYPGAGKPPIHFEVWEVTHFKTYNPHNRFVGLSPIESLADTIFNDQGQRKASRQIYTDFGGQPPSILAFKDWVPNDTWNEVLQTIDKQAKRNQMMALRGAGDGVTWMSRAVNSKEAEFIATLKNNLETIFNRMCPGLLSMLSENATEANALAARATYAEKTQWPMMEVIAQKITNDILPAYGRKLIGMYDDPRVVDRKLKLEEQTAYERTHTIAEVRREYYQDEPLGDERDKELAAGNKIPNVNNIPGNNVPENVTGNSEPPQLSTKSSDLIPIIQELDKWQKKAISNLSKKYVRWNAYNIPVDIANKLNDDLQLCVNEPAVKTVFDKVKSELQFNNLVNDTEERRILKAIELGVEALKTK